MAISSVQLDTIQIRKNRVLFKVTEQKKILRANCIIYETKNDNIKWSTQHHEVLMNK